MPEQRPTVIADHLLPGASFVHNEACSKNGSDELQELLYLTALSLDTFWSCRCTQIINASTPGRSEARLPSRAMGAGTAQQHRRDDIVGFN